MAPVDADESERCPQTDRRTRRTVVPEPLTEAGWSPFGWLPVADTDPRDGEQTMTFEWADAHVNLIGHARSEVPETPRGLRCEMLFRHDTHTQALMPLNVPAVIVVAPADVEFTDEADAALDPCLPDRAARVPGAAPGHLALGPVPDRGPRSPAVQRPGAPLRRGQPLRGPGRQGPLRRGGPVVTGRGQGRRSRPWSLTTPKRPRSCRPPSPSWSTPSRHARPGPDARWEADLHHDQPEMVGPRSRLRGHGGGPGAERRHADRPGRASRSTRCTATSCARRVPGPGRPTSWTAVRDGRSFSTRQVTSEVEGKETFRMTCSFHVPEDGDDYQLPVAPEIPPPARDRGIRGALPLRRP